MPNVLDRNFDFATNGTVTAAGLHNLIDETNIYAGLISTQEAKTTVGTGDLLLIADSSSIGSPQIVANRVTVQKLFDDGLTSGTFTNLNLTGALTYGTATGNRTVSTSATITTGTIQALTTGTTTSTNEVVTNGTITNLSATTSTFLGTITGSTNVINIGSGQIYKDASGNVGIGTNSPLVSAGFTSLTLNGTTSGILEIKSNGTQKGAFFNDGSLTRLRSSGTLAFDANNTEAMIIDSSGNVLVGGTNTEPAGNSTSGVAIKPPATSANGMVEICNANLTALVLGSTTGDATLARFRRAGAAVGSISVTAGATAFVTSSDYRLKTNLEPISNAIERIKQLPVYRFNWIADQSGNKVDGFIAHEAQPIVPEAIVGARDEIDAEGNPIYQGIDQSKIVPLLTAALKEAITKIEVLESKVAALEAA
jgi:hypothetical protein